MTDHITLRIDGRDWFGWKSVSITRQVDAIAGTASLTLADRWQHNMEAMPLAEGMACQLLVGSDSLLKGYIDELAISFSSTEHSISLALRDKTGDMVDCAAMNTGVRLANGNNGASSNANNEAASLNTRMGTGHFRKIGLLDLARALAKPFNIEVTANGDLGAPFASFKIEPGETAFTALDRALRQREVLALPDGQGNLRLTHIGQTSASDSLLEGGNLLSGQASYSMKERFSHYLVKGQQPGNDENYGPTAAFVKGEARDPNVPRYRPMLVRAENQVNAASALKRAQWEACVRAARAATIAVDVQGWRQTNGQLWPLGGLVSIQAIPSLRLADTRRVISKTTYRRDAGGTITSLELKHPDAFAPEPVKAGTQVSPALSAAVISDKDFAN